MSSSTYLDLLTLAAGELNVVAIGDLLTDNAAMAQRFLDRLTWMVDSWNLKPTVVPWYQQQIFNLIPGKQSYLIGTNSPDWNAPRPIRLDPNCSNLLLANTGVPTMGGFNGWYPEVIQVNQSPKGQPPYQINVNSVTAGTYPLSVWVNSGPPPSPFTGGVNAVRLPLHVLTVQQWANISLPTLAITFPQGCYLDRSVVTGMNSISGLPYYASRISVWGVPTTVNQVEFFYWQALTVGNLTDPVNAAPGYFRAMFLKLAIEIAPMFGITPSALTIANAADAFGDIKELNTPDMSSQADPGMPGSKAAGYITRSQFLSGVF